MISVRRKTILFDFTILRVLILLVLLLLDYHFYAQFSPSADAYKLFRGKSSNLKLRYLGFTPTGFPLVAQKLNDNQNLSYAKLGIRKVVVIRESKGTLDTLAIRKYDEKGYLIERDTFDLMYVHKGNRNLSKTFYEYLSKEKIVKVKSLSIVIKRDTTYEWQESLKTTFFYDLKDRLVIRKSWHFGNDTLNMCFELDSNDVVTGIKSYVQGIAYPSGHQFDYKLDEKGRLTNITRYFKFNNQYPGVKGDIKDVPYPDYDVNSIVTRIDYNDKEYSITVYPDKECHSSYILRKRQQVFKDYFCPLVEDRDTHTLVTGKSNGSTVYTTVIDRHGRVISVSVSAEVDENLQEKQEPSGRIVYKYEYNSKGLLSVVNTIATSNGWDQKIFFYYFTK